MRIVADGFELGPKGAGVSRVAKNIIPALASLFDDDLFFVLTREIALPFSRSNIQQIILPSGKRGYFRWQNGPFLRTCFRLKPHLLLAFNYTLPLICPWPSLLFVHDISLITHPEWFPRKTASWRSWLVKISLKQAKEVVVPSLATKNEILSHLKIREDKLNVVYYGLEDKFEPVAEEYRRGFKQAKGLTGRRIIGFLGSIFRRRHLPLLVSAVGCLRSEFPDLSLYVIGEDRTYPPQNVSSLLNQEWIRWEKFLPEIELPLFYSSCDVFVYLSEYEGFGLPPLEALACGTVPVVLSRSSLEEIFAEMAFLVDELNPETVALAIREALVNRDKRELLRKRFIERRSDFSWSKAVEKIAEIIWQFKKDKIIN
ncbi:MAG: glycosyltransferase family 4 protein [Candidatus Aminicenantes bacterium]|nr:glycosyltransferase family 4 protein [Candidatus Aminicenantes bacterium]